MITHPLTGEVLPDDLKELEHAEGIVDSYLRGQRNHYAFRRALRERIAELRGPAQLPPPRYRTDTQMRVAECARCGAKPDRKAKANVAGEQNPFHEEEQPLVLGLS